jgi:hypothetical protein
MVIFRREFRNPFELVAVRRSDFILGQDRSEPVIRIDGFDYEIDEDSCVKIPELLLGSEPSSSDFFDWTPVAVPTPRTPDQPEVTLREAVRLCLEKEIPTDKISEIVKLELVNFVMES